jgi:PAS domain S-box-containing protein
VTGRSPQVDPPDGVDRARQIVEGLGDGFLSLDAEWRITDCNRVIERFLNRRRRSLLGREIWKISGVAIGSPFGVLARRVATTRAAEEAEVAYPRRRDRRLLTVRVFPLGAGIGAVWRDITEIRAAGLELAEREANYRELADGTPAAAFLSRADGTLAFLNQAMTDALGRPREALLGDGWMNAIDPDDRATALQARSEWRTTHSSFDYEGRFRRADGTLRIIQLHGRPRFDRSGAFNGHAGMATDVTDARAAERRQQLLIDELNHRVKNTLSTVLSLVRQTFGQDELAKDRIRRLTDRLMALSAAHDVLTQELWESADLAVIAPAAVQPHADGGRIAFVGPTARVAPHIALALSMALHELATNALKHGALATPSGRVQVTWTLADDTIELEWRERDGAAVSAPERAGFGSRLLGRALATDLGRAAELIFAPEGLICRIRAPALSSEGRL